MSETVPAETTGHPGWTRLILIALTIIALDQSTKFLAVKNLTHAFENAHAVTLRQQIDTFIHSRHLMFQTKQHIDVVPWFWSNRYAENPGAAWSLLASAPEKVRVPFFHVVSVIAILLIGAYYSRLRPDQKLLGIALSFVMGGALGNLTDRLVRGYVIDFIDWHINDPNWNTRLHWPTFNVADTGISLGVALIALDTLLSWWHLRKTAPTPAPADA
jgi:signal peptidase II